MSCVIHIKYTRSYYQSHNRHYLTWCNLSAPVSMACWSCCHGFTLTVKNVELPPLGLHGFSENHSIAADSRPGIDDQTNMAEQTGHLTSLGPESKNGWAVTEIHLYSSQIHMITPSLGLHMWALIPSKAWPSQHISYGAASDTESNTDAVHHSFLACCNYGRVGLSPWKTHISSGFIRAFWKWG